MITIGYSTRISNPTYKEYLQKTCMYKDVEIIEKINNGEVNQGIGPLYIRPTDAKIPTKRTIF